MDVMEEEEPMPDESLIDDFNVDIDYLEDLMYKTGAMKLLCPELADHDYTQGEQIRKEEKKSSSTGNDGQGVDGADISQMHQPLAPEIRVDKPKIDQPPAMLRAEAPPTTGQRAFISRGPISATDLVRRQFQPPFHPSRIQSPQKPTAAVRITESAPQMIHRPDPPPHRMVERAPAGPPMPKVKAYNSPSEQPPQQVIGNGQAPMIVPSRGSKPQKRGSSYSRGKKDDNVPQEGEQIPTAAIPVPPMQSPRKVHFHGDVTHMSPHGREERFHHEPSGLSHSLVVRQHAGSPVKSPMRDNALSTSSLALEAVPVPAVAMPHTAIHQEDPNPLPDSIIDDTPDPVSPQRKDEPALPSHLAEIVVNLMPEFQQAPVELTPDGVKERISRIAEELVKSSAEHQRTPTSSDRGRQRSIVRHERTVSTSSMSSSGMPAFVSPIRRTAAGISPPVRTNLDFNSHLKSHAALPTHHHAPIPRKELQKVPPKVAAKKESPKKQGRSNNKKLPYSSDEDDDEWEEEDWTTRCICGFEDNYGDMVECEGCSVWQHYACNDMPANADTNGWRCEECDPSKILPFTREQANRRMRQLLKNVNAQDSPVASKTVSHPVPSTLKKTSVVTEKTSSARKSEQPAAKNTYTKRAKQMLTTFGKEGAFQGKEAVKAYEKMMVAHGVEGLVATKDILDGMAVVEIVGNVCIPDEAGAELGTFFNQFVFVYDGIGDAKGGSRDSVCVDARKQSSDGRYVRRCCCPNASIQHKISSGVATFFVVTREKVTKGAEITVPFDLGYRPMKNTTPCRCAKTDDLSSCLLSSQAFTGPGHRPSVAKTPADAVEKRKSSRSKKDELSNNNLSGDTSTPKVSRDEKSEEESVVVAKQLAEAETPNTRMRGKTVAAKRGSDKEEVSKAEPAVTEKKPRKDSISEKRASDLQKSAEAVKFVIHHEKSTMSREERKLQALMSRFEGNNEAKTASKKKEDQKTQTEKRRGRTVVDTRKRRNTDSVSKDEGSSSRATSPPQKKLRHDSERSTMPAKKGWMARHEAQSSENSSSEASSRKSRDAGENEVANVLAAMHNGSNFNLREEMQKKALEMQKKAKMEDFKLPPDMHKMITDHQQKMLKAERSQERARGTPQERAKEASREKSGRENTAAREKDQPKDSILPPSAKPSTSQMAEPAKEKSAGPTARRMSYEEYKKRKATDPAPPEEVKVTIRAPFMPVLTDDDLLPNTLPPIVLPRDTDKTTRPAALPPPTPRTSTRHSPRGLPPPPPRATSVERSAAMATPPAPERMSIADRLAVEFGIGTLSSPRRSDPR